MFLSITFTHKLTDSYQSCISFNKNKPFCHFMQYLNLFYFDLWSLSRFKNKQAFPLFNRGPFTVLSNFVILYLFFWNTYFLICCFQFLNFWDKLKTSYEQVQFSVFLIIHIGPRSFRHQCVICGTVKYEVTSFLIAHHYWYPDFNPNLFMCHFRLWYVKRQATKVRTLNGKCAWNVTVLLHDILWFYFSH